MIESRNDRAVKSNITDTFPAPLKGIFVGREYLREQERWAGVKCWQARSQDNCPYSTFLVRNPEHSDISNHFTHPAPH
jgi:hypothetical protein